MQTNKSQRSLKNLLINPNFQFRYAFYFAAVGGMGIGILYLPLSAKLNDLLDEILALHSVNPAVQQTVTNLIYEISTQALIAFLVTLIFSFGFAIFITHRIAGAAYAIEKYIRDIREGKFDVERSLRKKDDLQSIMAELRLLAKSLKEKQRN